jgi:hypothetical protein
MGHRNPSEARVPEQFSFFVPESHDPEGIRCAEDFVTAEAEKALIGHITALPLQPFQFGQYEGKRRVASFGSDTITPSAGCRRPI